MVSTLSNTFVERLLSSQLLDPAQLAACRAAVGDGEAELVEHLAKNEMLTRFQIRQLRAGATSFFVGKYEVVDCLGRGGNGIVFKGRHRLLPNRYVALKTLDTRNLHHGEESMVRFRREIDIVARLEHPHIVRALDVLQTRSHLYLVLEYIAGQDLGVLVKKRGPLPFDEAVDFVLQAARGLAYAHASGVIHRDLKPVNMLLTTDGVVKLTDLGLARLFAEEPQDMTVKGLCLGTPEFMAPEQAEDVSSADQRSDIYSLGTTLFHLLTAELPVTGSNTLQRLQKLLSHPPRPLLDSRPDAPPELAAIVDRMRSRHAADRPQTVQQVIALLEPFGIQASTGQAAIWDADRKADLVLEVLTGQLTPSAACARHDLPANQIQEWQRQFVEGGRKALDPRAAKSDAETQDKLRQLLAKIGEQTLEIEALKKR